MELISSCFGEDVHHVFDERIILIDLWQVYNIGKYHNAGDLTFVEGPQSWMCTSSLHTILKAL